MKTVRIGSRDTVFQPVEANTTYLLAKGRLIDSTTSGIYEPAGLEDMTIEIQGRIKSLEAGIRLGTGMSPAAGLEITIAETGRISTQQRAIEVSATDHRIVNAGLLDAVEGIRSSGTHGVIINRGTIDATGTGIIASGPHQITNSGSIAGAAYGISLNATEDGGGAVRNTGTITGGISAIVGSSSADRFFNSGVVEGKVSLLGGDDVAVLKGGSMADEVNGGMGNDRFVVHVNGVELSEGFGEGFDLVKSSVSFTIDSYIEQVNLIGKRNVDATGNDQDNHLQGNAGRNILHGEGGVDFLVGMAGNDILFGGDGADVFNFQPGSGTDTVMDFTAGIDEIQIGLKGATDFTDMIANHVEVKGGDVWITYAQDVIILKDTVMAELTSGDFVFPLAGP